MAYATYFSARSPELPAASRQRRVARVYGMQAEANARAAAAADETAYQGAVSDDTDIGWWITATGAGAGNTSATLPVGEIPAATARKRAAARQVHQALIAWTAALAAEGIAHAAAVVAVGHDFLFRAHQATYLVCTRGGYTVTQLEDWAGKMAMGAADVTSPATFFARMEAGAGLTSPTGPCAWVRFDGAGAGAAAERVNLADAVAASGSRRSGGGEGNLDLDPSHLPAGGLAADGSWIDSLV